MIVQTRTSLFALRLIVEQILKYRPGIYLLVVLTLVMLCYGCSLFGLPSFFPFLQCSCGEKSRTGILGCVGSRDNENSPNYRIL